MNRVLIEDRRLVWLIDESGALDDLHMMMPVDMDAYAASARLEAKYDAGALDDDNALQYIDKDE